MGDISSSTTFYILLLFVSIYVFSISSYTYTASLSNVDLWQKKKNDIHLTRLKRDATLVDNWTQNITINICCPKNYRLNEKFECVEAKKGNFTEQFEEVWKNLVVDGNLAESFINSSRIILKYNNSNFLSADDKYVVQWSSTKPASHYFSQQDGSLLELNLKQQEVLSKFSSASFCLDRIRNAERTFVAIVTPCEEVMCIQKCCKKGFYYNTIQNKCFAENENQMTSFKPTFFNKIEEIGMNISHFIIEGVPKCFGPDTQIKIYESPSPIYVQWNGSLLTVDEFENVYYFYHGKKYCIDLFSDGTKNNTYVNGFYCQNDTMVKYPFGTNTGMPNLEPNAIVDAQKKENLPEGKVEHLKDSIGETLGNVGNKIENVGKKIAQVAVAAKDKTSEVGKKAVSRLSQARSCGEMSVTSMILGMFTLVKYAF
ncbi:uncharacterized protein [Leptinotarsa decemlineata]|uniref:uncharacterized protein n=1 Tax=Leptinotarsa decemlineata TaxID=7539 RepID=UPI003D3075AA